MEPSRPRKHSRTYSLKWKSTCDIFSASGRERNLHAKNIAGRFIPSRCHPSRRPPHPAVPGFVRVGPGKDAARTCRMARGCRPDNDQDGKGRLSQALDLAEREKFIRFFWRARDPDPDTAVNEFEQEYAERIRVRRPDFRPRVGETGQPDGAGLLLPPARQAARAPGLCHPVPGLAVELWFCKGDEAAGMPPYFYLIFFQPEGNGDFRLYSPSMDGPEKLVVPLMYGETASSKGNAMEFIKTSAPSWPRPPRAICQRKRCSARLPWLGPYHRRHQAGAREKIFRRLRALLSGHEGPHRDGIFRPVLSGSYLVKVFRDGGLAFVNWAIEPDKMNFASDGNVIRASFELVLKIEDKAGVSVFERTEEIPLRLTPEQYRSHEKQRFSFQDVLPLIPGEYRMFFLLKNKTGKDFSTFDTEITVPIAREPYLGAPLLFLAAEAPPASMAGKSKAFLIGGRQYVVGARNEFMLGSSLGVLAQAWNMSGSGTYEVEIVSLDTSRPNAVLSADGVARRRERPRDRQRLGGHPARVVPTRLLPGRSLVQGRVREEDPGPQRQLRHSVRPPSRSSPGSTPACTRERSRRRT